MSTAQGINYTLEELKKIFRRVFHCDPEIAVAGPGRVNIIGEHTDYNDGFVLPAAIDREVIILGSSRADRTVRIYSVNYDEESSFSLDAIARAEDQAWSNYERGVADILQKAGHALAGADMLISGNVPLGAGLSSSAAVEVATGAAFRALFGLEISDRDLALLAQKAENEFVGMRCGIMDQFASCLSRENTFLFLDCRSLNVEYVPLPSGGTSIVLCNTNAPRQLVGSEYNRRREECEEAVRMISRKHPAIKALRDVSEELLEQVMPELPPVVGKRARHVVGENRRVLECIALLKRGDFPGAAALLNDSHASLRDLYEVSCRELDIMAEIAWDTKGVLGARMMGGGFGGCTINIVRNEAVGGFEERIARLYPEKSGRTPDIFICRISQGVRVLPLGY